MSEVGIQEHLATALRRGSMPGWMIIAQAELGQVEVPGAINNPRIVAYHASTRGGEAADEVPWCSSFACWVLERVGIRTPRSKRALDWQSWGVASEGTPGAVAVLNYGAGRGHVGFVVASGGPGRVWLLGGNQGNAVSVRAFDRARVVAYRMPPPAVIVSSGSTEPDTR